MSAEPYELGLTRPARRAISEVLPEDVAAAAVEFTTGPLLEAPYRVGKPLRDKLAGIHSARLGTQWRVLYRIDKSKRVVVVQDIQHRSSAYRHRLTLRQPLAPSALRRAIPCLGSASCEVGRQDSPPRPRAQAVAASWTVRSRPYRGMSVI